MNSTDEGYQWKPTRFDLPEHYAFVAYYDTGAGPDEGKPWNAYIARGVVNSWHATADEAKAAVEAALGTDR